MKRNAARPAVAVAAILIHAADRPTGGAVTWGQARPVCQPPTVEPRLCTDVDADVTCAGCRAWLADEAAVARRVERGVEGCMAALVLVGYVVAAGWVA